MGKYKKCPRCELNYIPQDEEMCDVCKSELGLATNLLMIDDIIDDDEPLKLCPVCKTAYIGMDEEMCENCLAHDKETEEVDEDNDDWRSYLDDDDDPKDAGSDVISLEELENDEDFDDDDEFDDEENQDLELDDYPDDFDDLELDDDDLDDDEEEDEEDED